uniref:Serine protease n=1 Tax=Parastrongyloides trichosuri TaxID=131310 RepID=A0A0N4ZVQ1_PARTI
MKPVPPCAAQGQAVGRRRAHGDATAVRLVGRLTDDLGEGGQGAGQGRLVAGAGLVGCLGRLYAPVMGGAVEHPVPGRRGVTAPGDGQKRRRPPGPVSLSRHWRQRQVGRQPRRSPARGQHHGVRLDQDGAVVALHAPAARPTAPVWRWSARPGPGPSSDRRALWVRPGAQNRRRGPASAWRLRATGAEPRSCRSARRRAAPAPVAAPPRRRRRRAGRGTGFPPAPAPGRGIRR